MDINGFTYPEQYTSNILFEHVQLPVNSTVRIKNAEAIAFKNVNCTDGAKPTYDIIESKAIVN